MIRQILSNFVISVMLMGSAILLTIGDDKGVTTVNQKLDVVFVFDQSDSVYEYPETLTYAVDGLRKWTLEFSSGKKDLISFAMMRCKESNPFIQFDQNKNSTYVASKFPYNANDFEGENNVGPCFEQVKEKILVQEEGDRPDAPNVILYLTDCNFLLEDDFRLVQEFHNLFKYTGGYLGVICTTTKENGLWVFKYEKIKRKILMEAIHNDENSLIVFYNESQLKKLLNERLPNATFKVANCETGETPETCMCESSWNSGNMSRNETVPCPEQIRNEIHDQRKEEAKRKEEEAKSATIIGGVIGGLLFLILLIIILVVVVMSQRRGRDKGAKGKRGKAAHTSETKGQKEKKKGVQVDITCNDESVASKKHKQSKMAKSRQSSAVSTTKSKVTKDGKSPKASVSSPKSKATKVGKSAKRKP